MASNRGRRGCAHMFEAAGNRPSVDLLRQHFKSDFVEWMLRIRALRQQAPQQDLRGGMRMDPKSNAYRGMGTSSLRVKGGTGWSAMRPPADAPAPCASGCAMIASSRSFVCAGAPPPAAPALASMAALPRGPAAGLPSRWRLSARRRGSTGREGAPEVPPVPPPSRPEPVAGCAAPPEPAKPASSSSAVSAGAAPTSPMTPCRWRAPAGLATACGQPIWVHGVCCASGAICRMRGIRQPGGLNSLSAPSAAAAKSAATWTEAQSLRPPARTRLCAQRTP